MRLFASILGVGLPFGAMVYGQSGADILGGPAGWAGAGLLGLVLSWLLLKHLPEKDRQITDMVGTKDKQIGDLLARNDERQDAQRKEHTDAIGTLTSTFKAEQMAERQACEKRFETLASSMQTSFENLSSSTQTSFKAIGELLQSQANRERQWAERLERQAREKHKAEGGK